ncbi:MAG: hypothetical protein JO287_18585 [Pseudonocardiales bacterium]|nr:hypothetical protein [Pseudonocardiales bacterium]
MTLTIPWIWLLVVLHGIGVPRIFILIVGMAYRYIFLLLASEEPRTVTTDVDGAHPEDSL